MQIDLQKTQSYLEWTKTMLFLDSISSKAKQRIIKRGQVYRCNLGTGIGSEEGKERPCVILQRNSSNSKSPNTIVAPITHSSSTLDIVIPIQDKFDINQDLILDGNVLLGNVVTVSKARLGAYICDLNNSEMKAIDIALASSLDIKKHYDKLKAIHDDKLEGFRDFAGNKKAT